MTAIIGINVVYNDANDNLSNIINLSVKRFAPDALIGAFDGRLLTSVIIPNTITYIGSFTFRDNKLTNLTIPNSVTTIGNWAFKNNNLEYVLIKEGSNLTSIGDAAFASPNNNLTIYNNSGKSFDWGSIAQARSDDTYAFVTGSIPSYSSYGPVEVVTGYPS